MVNPDMIVICGLPRSGTSFLHNMFAEYGMENDIFALHEISTAGRFMAYAVKKSKADYSLQALSSDILRSI